MVDVTLALGGGGSKGYSHLGVIRSLESRGFKIRGIAGTSAGGMAGAIYAAGYSIAEILEKISDIRQEDIYVFGRGPGLLGTKGLEQVLHRFLGGKTFSDLEIPFAVTAVDLKAMTEVVLQEGNVLDAVLATTAIPGIFPPRVLNELLLVDGVVLNPIPVAIARSLAPSLPVIAVSLVPEPDRWHISFPWDAPSTNPLLRPISKLRFAKAFEVYLRSTEMTSHMLSEMRLELEKPDLIIRPEVASIGSLDRVDIQDVARLGDQAVEKMDKEVKRIGKKQSWFSRKN
ncbi:MAG: patatin-like phospholipase family protein [Chloroflexi bacterium]|nr:patatin-like phospholipase family protein [Chloroflexota bacterium]